MNIAGWNFDRNFVIFFSLFVVGTVDAKMKGDYALLAASFVWAFVWTQREKGVNS